MTSPRRAPYSAVLFDLDGTLLDTLDDLTESANQVLAELGAPAHPRDAYRHFVGDGVEMLGRRALPASIRDDSYVARFVARMREVYAPRETLKTLPYPGIPELLDGLRERSITMCVLSNKPDSATNSIVGKLLGAWPFACVHGQRPTIARKPDPAGATAIAAELGIAPESFLYLGDTSTDMQTARSAGMFAVGALWGFRDERELREHGAQAIVRAPREVLDLLGAT